MATVEDPKTQSTISLVTNDLKTISGQIREIRHAFKNALTKQLPKNSANTTGDLSEQVAHLKQAVVEKDRTIRKLKAENKPVADRNEELNELVAKLKARVKEAEAATNTNLGRLQEHNDSLKVKIEQVRKERGQV